MFILEQKARNLEGRTDGKTTKNRKCELSQSWPDYRVFITVSFDIWLGIFRTDFTLKMSKGKATPLQAWTALKGSRRLGLPDF
jgi:hypothetical protein